MSWDESSRTCDDRLTISLRNQGTQVRDSIDKMAKKVIKTTNLEKQNQHVEMNNKFC